MQRLVREVIAAAKAHRATLCRPLAILRFSQRQPADFRQQILLFRCCEECFAVGETRRPGRGRCKQLALASSAHLLCATLRGSFFTTDFAFVALVTFLDFPTFFATGLSDNSIHAGA